MDCFPHATLRKQGVNDYPPSPAKDLAASGPTNKRDCLSRPCIPLGGVSAPPPTVEDLSHAGTNKKHTLLLQGAKGWIKEGCAALHNIWFRLSLLILVFLLLFLLLFLLGFFFLLVTVFTLHIIISVIFVTKGIFLKLALKHSFRDRHMVIIQ